MIIGAEGGRTTLLQRRRGRSPFRSNPGEVVSTIALVHSLTANRAGSIPLNGVTLPEFAYIRLVTTGTPGLRARFFVGPVGSFAVLSALPPFSTATTPEEQAHPAYVRGDSTVPHDLMGGPINGTAIAWDTKLDPKANSDRSHFHTNGDSDVLGQLLLPNGQILSEIATVTRAFAPVAVNPNPPTGLAGTPGTNQIVVTWVNGGTGGGADPTTGYEIAYSNTDTTPDTYVPVTPFAPTTTLTVAPGVWSIRVRAVDADGQRSTPTTVISVTVTGSTIQPGKRITPQLGLKQYPFRKGGNPGEGALNDPANYVGIGRAWHEANIAKDAANNNSLPTQCQQTLDQWNNRANALGAHYVNAPNTVIGITGGPRAMINLPIGYGPAPSARPGGQDRNITSPTTNNVRSLIQVAQVITGQWDAHYTAMANTIIGYNSANGGLGLGDATNGYWKDWEKRIMIRLGHENNGPWYPWYSGWDQHFTTWFNGLTGTYDPATGTATLKKHTDFVSKVAGLPLAIKNALCVADPVRNAANRGPLYREAFRHIVDRFRAVNDGFIFDWNVSHPGADPDGSEDPNDLTRDFNPDAWVGADYADLATLDVYARGSGRVNAQGMSDDMVEFLHEYKTMVDGFSATDGRRVAMGFGEVGIGINFLTRNATITHKSFNAASNTFLIRTSTEHGLRVGSPVTVSNLDPGPAPGGGRTAVYNGNWRVAAVSKSTTPGPIDQLTYVDTPAPTDLPRQTQALTADPGNVAQMTGSEGCTDAGASRWVDQWCRLLDGTRVLNPVTGAEMFAANFLGPIGYWMWWNSNGAGQGLRTYHFYPHRGDDPLAWAMYESHFTLA